MTMVMGGLELRCVGVSATNGFIGLGFWVGGSFQGSGIQPTCAPPVYTLIRVDEAMVVAFNGCP